MAKKGAFAFRADLGKFAEKVDIEIAQAVQYVAIDLFIKIVEKTPVDKGRLRASWTITVGPSNATWVAPESAEGMGRAQSRTMAMKTVSALPQPKIGDVYHITNNMPYARVVEFGEFKGEGPKISGGFSKQSIKHGTPYGMVRVSIKEVQEGIGLIIDEAV